MTKFITTRNTVPNVGANYTIESKEILTMYSAKEMQEIEEFGRAISNAAGGLINIYGEKRMDTCKFVAGYLYSNGYRKQDKRKSSNQNGIMENYQNNIKDEIYNAINNGLKKWLETYCGRIDAADTRKAANLTIMGEYVQEAVAVAIEKSIEPLILDYEEYRERCSLIVDIGFDYDGTNTKSASAMKELVDELVGFAREGVSMSIGNSGNVKYPRYVTLDVDADKLIRTLNEQIHKINSACSEANDELLDRYIEMKKRAEEAENKLKNISKRKK